MSHATDAAAEILDFEDRLHKGQLAAVPAAPAIDRHQFAAHLVMRDLADQTIRNYTAMFVRWVDWSVANGTDPFAPGILEVRSWSKTIEGGRSILAHARSMIHHLCEALDVEDASAAIYLPRHPKRVHRGLDDDAVRKLAAQALTCGIKGLAVFVGLYTAARRSEMASLAWRHIDLQARTVTLTRPKTRDLHTVPMHPHLHELLESRHVPGELWVFSGRWGGHVSPATIGTWIDDVADKAGIGHITSHQLRHTALSAAYHATKDIRAVQDLAGHTNIETTVVYTRVHRDRLSAAVNSLTYSSDDTASNAEGGPA